MRKLLSSPVKMSLSAAENQIYQNVLKYVTPLSLNLMAIKVDSRPEEFIGWCGELITLCTNDLNIEFLDKEQFLPLKKLQENLEAGFTIGQCKMARIAPWPIFVSFIEQQNERHALDERLRLLNYIATIRQQLLADLSIEDRLVFAGKHTAKHNYQVYDFDSEWFVSTKSAKIFHVLLEESPEKFDAALAHIPLIGEVNYDHYEKFVSEFQQIFLDYAQKKSNDEPEKVAVKGSIKNKAPLAVATRLLAMRRPDQFIALTNSKIDIYCKGLSIVKFSNTDFSSYWHDLIGTLRTFPWFNHSKPDVITDTASKNVLEIDAEDNDKEQVKPSNIEVQGDAYRELLLWNNRAILIDLFLYADVDLSQNSNYIRARDKTLNKSMHKPQNKLKTTSKKKSKESIEMIVDKALASEDLPEYMQSKRDSIIIQVKKGNSVEKVLSLMRAIFG